ncbi:Short-chain dehydrogenase sdnK [Colletotrichum gloeosporioides]|uniref:Short-chain dehydrogenase sdnK n=1 Tax=Colletotrichum gloeosporioides TaxID=474922 RepID=A0A8H4CL46_COLGL|nr:Short-chain dehydrogenase sdnK [Colletotrichum gloeosporioides]KAF3805692.1 Short-chain dehydrogenase sdnK [Colletotrichum gloeosporioides]
MDTMGFIRAQRQNLPIVPTKETCAGKTFIITGSNSGIGFEAVKHLVNLGSSRVIIAVRSIEKGQDAKARVDASTGRPEVTEVWQLDMSSYESIRAFAKRASSELSRLDGLVENATAALDRWTIAEGMETSVTVNVIGTVMLTLLLHPKLMETTKTSGSQPHIVIVTSGLGFTQPDFLKYADKDIFDVLNTQGESPIEKRYSVTKLVQILAIRQLATMLPASRTGVVLNLLNPGLCNTGLAKYGRMTLRLQIRMFNALIGRTPEMGSRTILHSMFGGAESHGQYVSDCEIKDHWVPEWVKNEDGRKFQNMVWTQLAARLEQIEPRCVEKLVA